MINFSGWFRGLGPSLAALIALGCGAAAHPEGDRRVEALAAPDRLWVLAPHPDDEVLMAGVLLHQAVVRGRPHTVLVMTNGDLGCGRDGHARQRETLAALAELGVAEENVHFLGYPDGWLDALGPAPFGPVPRTQPDGSCGSGDRTYAEHGAGGVDLHTLRTGAPGLYVAEGPVDDLVWLLEREMPTEIVTTHGIDTHPDHAMTYVYLRRALARAPSLAPRVLRSVVHQGPCWPNGAGTPPCPDVRDTQGTPFPAFAPPLEGYAPTLRVASDDGGALLRTAIAHYTTQLEAPVPEASWLSSFARGDEIFFVEDRTGEPDARASVRASFTIGGQLALEGVQLVVDARGATLREGERVLREMPVPHGEDPALEHAWSLSRRGVELELARDDELWVLAVVRGVAPRSRTESGKRPQPSASRD